MSPYSRVSQIHEIKEKYGFSGIPITEDGQMGSKLVGLVTRRDVDFIGEGQEDKQLFEVLLLPCRHCFYIHFSVF